MNTNNTNKQLTVLALAALTAVGAWPTQADSMPTGFTYQGRLTDGTNAANGSYDFRCAIYDAATNGNPVGSVGTNAATTVANGYFDISVDFGDWAFLGEARWLEIGVRTNGGGTFSILSPRQALTPVPNALFAARAGQVPASTLTGTVPDAALSTNVALLTTNAQFLGTVGATRFQGNGAGLSNVAGTLPWETVTASWRQAAPDHGYLAKSDGRVVITLPTAPAETDIVRVSGAGGGGWQISQSAGQVILTDGLGDIGIGDVWTPRGSDACWASLASSGDGSRLVAGLSGDQIQVSHDFGRTWTARGPSGYWEGVASSADGTRLAAVPQYGYPYTCTFSGGVWTWVPRLVDKQRYFTAVAMSADGSTVVAAENTGSYPGPVHISGDYGATWLPRVTNYWNAVACSADGNTIYAAGTGTKLYATDTHGIIWWLRDTNRQWRALACSADGTRLIASADNRLLTSADSGATWTVRESTRTWSAVACSADGTRLFAAAMANRIYYSSDSGVTWVARESNRLWSSLTCSADGLRAVAGVCDETPARVYTAGASTSLGTGGGLRGDRGTAVELQYIGNGQFIVLSYSGTVVPF